MTTRFRSLLDAMTPAEMAAAAERLRGQGYDLEEVGPEDLQELPAVRRQLAAGRQSQGWSETARLSTPDGQDFLLLLAGRADLTRMVSLTGDKGRSRIELLAAAILTSQM